jgi:hypothetical protein
MGIGIAYANGCNLGEGATRAIAGPDCLEVSRAPGIWPPEEGIIVCRFADPPKLKWGGLGVPVVAINKQQTNQYVTIASQQVLW